jgi:hypothetical protein
VHRIPGVSSRLKNENMEVKVRLEVIEGGEFGKQIAHDVFQKEEVESSEEKGQSGLPRRKDGHRYYAKYNFIKRKTAIELEKVEKGQD